MDWFNHAKIMVWRDTMFRRVDLARRVVPGTTFQRVHADRMVETARVLSVGKDYDGIPHVNFQVSFRRPYRGTFDEDRRMLTLEAFADRYKELTPA